MTNVYTARVFMMTLHSLLFSTLPNQDCNNKISNDTAGYDQYCQKCRLLPYLKQVVVLKAFLA
jgi:hypothetical protein